MKMKILIITIGCILNMMAVTAQQPGTFRDTRDGKVYKTVVIGKQTWMAENLAYKAGAGCWSYPEDDDFEEESIFSNIKIFGYLYSWETAKKVCPAGWHLPTNEEWAILIKTLEGEKEAGYKMKSATGWKDNGNGSNESGFNALGGGNVYPQSGYENFYYIFKFGNWWSASLENDLSRCFRVLYNSNNIFGMYEGPENGVSVRCIKD